MIEFDEVSKVYGSVPGRSDAALRAVSLAIPRGEVWAVVGPNGAGKTTLLGLLLGFLNASHGEVRIDGAAPRRYLRKEGAAYLPERFRLPGEWRVLAALRALARLEGHNATDAREHAGAAMDRLGLGELASKRIGTLSRGQLQRVGLAQTLLAERDLVVLDEPTEGLDPLWRIRFRELIEALRSPDRVILIASHDLAELERIADRAVLLDAGQVRDVLEIGGSTEPSRRYRIELATSVTDFGEYFPGAAYETTGHGVEHGTDGPAIGRPAGPGRCFMVSVRDEEELNDRLAALLAAGGRVRSIEPLSEALEERVRRALAEGSS